MEEYTYFLVFNKTSKIGKKLQETLQRGRKKQGRGVPRPYRNQLSILNSNLSLPTDISA